MRKRVDSTAVRGYLVSFTGDGSQMGEGVKMGTNMAMRRGYDGPYVVRRALSGRRRDERGRGRSGGEHTSR